MLLPTTAVHRAGAAVACLLGPPVEACLDHHASHGHNHIANSTLGPVQVSCDHQTGLELNNGTTPGAVRSRGLPDLQQELHGAAAGAARQLLRRREVHWLQPGLAQRGNRTARQPHGTAQHGSARRDTVRHTAKVGKSETQGTCLHVSRLPPSGPGQPLLPPSYVRGIAHLESITAPCHPSIPTQPCSAPLRYLPACRPLCWGSGAAAGPLGSQAAPRNRGSTAAATRRRGTKHAVTTRGRNTKRLRTQPALPKGITPVWHRAARTPTPVDGRGWQRRNAAGPTSRSSTSSSDTSSSSTSRGRPGMASGWRCKQSGCCRAAAVGQ